MLNIDTYKINQRVGAVIASLLMGLFVASVMPAQLVQAQASAESDICNSIGGQWSAAGCTTPGPTLNNTIADIVNVLSMIVGVVSVIMIIIGGLKYVTSNGDPAASKSAKNTILFAIVGIVVVAIAQAIVQFVLQATI
jgi:cytochrome bd-type quinol oxidase subunit 2